jgi:hypothetical protein
MIELAFIACLSAAPASCEDRALQFSNITLMACNFGAQPELAQWVNEHPGWRIQRWTCRPIGSELEI